jgi:hypothetical protein
MLGGVQNTGAPARLYIYLWMELPEFAAFHHGTSLEIPSCAQYKFDR